MSLHESGDFNRQEEWTKGFCLGFPSESRSCPSWYCLSSGRERLSVFLYIFIRRDRSCTLRCRAVSIVFRWVATQIWGQGASSFPPTSVASVSLWMALPGVASAPSQIVCLWRARSGWRWLQLRRQARPRVGSRCGINRSGNVVLKVHRSCPSCSTFNNSFVVDYHWTWSTDIAKN